MFLLFQELRELFPILLHDLFGYQNLPNWGLHFLEPRAHSSDYNAMKNFLGPKGTIFKIIDKLMTDHDAIFQLPFEILPVCKIFLCDLFRINEVEIVEITKSYIVIAN